MDLSNTDLVRTHRYINDCSFSEFDLIKRKNDMKALTELYPHLCPSMIEMAWNFCNLHTEEQLQDIIASKAFEKPSTKEMGGSYLGCHVEPLAELPVLSDPTII